MLTVPGEQGAPGAPPPPPELQLSGGRQTLVWRPARPGPGPAAARHPLLIASGGTPPIQGVNPAPSRRPSWLGRLARPNLRPGRPAGHAALPALEPPGGERGHPLVLVVAGGPGGVGRSTLALELAHSLARAQASSGRRVLLVEGDPVHADLDLRLGAADLGGDRWPSARLDQLLLRLPELAERRMSVDSRLWIDRRSGLRAILAPGPDAEIGREHLDYLFTYVLAPAFDAVVVDAGPALPEERTGRAALSRFWLESADVVLVPLRPTPAATRAAEAAGRALDGLGIPQERCRLVLAVERSESGEARTCQQRLSGYPISRWPWAPGVARRASASQVALAELDPAFAEAAARLLSELALVRGRARR